MSEPETEAVVDFFREEITGKGVAAISFHSFGQVFFLPYAYKGKEVPNVKVFFFSFQK